ncbi:MAG: M15 family metallopeptidase [Clostridia bacterium]|nr:M15 family metallopeptidase [Clostridia bacterium]
MRRIFILLTVLCLLPAVCAAEDELSILDTDELIIEEIEGDDYGVFWDFPVALEDLDPELIVLANKHYVLDEKYGSSSMVKMKTRKANKDGSNANGGVLKAPGSGTLQLQTECAEALVAMCEGAREDGYKLYLKSSYRSYSTQKTMYNNRLKKNKGKDDGWVAKPGTSDHQTGLGCDVVPRSWYDRAMNEKMAATEECIWMAEHCQEYGFILRYPKDKQDVTEINYEPWHMRYVGIPVATYIMENGMCLEEFNDELQAAIAIYLENGGDRERVEALIREPNN